VYVPVARLEHQMPGTGVCTWFGTAECLVQVFAQNNNIVSAGFCGRFRTAKCLVQLPLAGSEQQDAWHSRL